MLVVRVHSIEEGMDAFLVYEGSIDEIEKLAKKAKKAIDDSANSVQYKLSLKYIEANDELEEIDDFQVFQDKSLDTEEIDFSYIEFFDDEWFGLGGYRNDCLWYTQAGVTLTAWKEELEVLGRMDG